MNIDSADSLIPKNVNSFISVRSRLPPSRHHTSQWANGDRPRFQSAEFDVWRTGRVGLPGLPGRTRRPGAVAISSLKMNLSHRTGLAGLFLAQYWVQWEHVNSR